MDTKHFIRPALGTGMLLLVPAVMNIMDRGKPPGDGWNWGPGDFLTMGALLFCAGLIYEMVATKTRTRQQKWAVGAAVAVVVFLIWLQLAVEGLSKLAGWLLG